MVFEYTYIPIWSSNLLVTFLSTEAAICASSKISSGDAAQRRAISRIVSLNQLSKQYDAQPVANLTETTHENLYSRS